MSTGMLSYENLYESYEVTKFDFSGLQPFSHESLQTDHFVVTISNLWMKNHVSSLAKNACIAVRQKITPLLLSPRNTTR